MIFSSLRNVKARLLVAYRYLIRHRGLWLRGTLCWALGMDFLSAENNNNFDLRFKIRGTQKHSEDIVIVKISQTEWEQLQGQKPNWLNPLKEITSTTDSYYWDPKIWPRLLETILQNQPRVIGVDFFFGNNIAKPSDQILSSQIFTDPRILWASQVDSEGRVLVPLFTDNYDRNTGVNGMIQDPDNSVRRIISPSVQIPHLAYRVAQRVPSEASKSALAFLSGQSHLINYQGPTDTYSHISLTQVLNGDFPSSLFRNKVVLIGSPDKEGGRLLTPVGRLSKTEILANVVDNLVNNKTVRSMTFACSSVLLFFLLVFSIWIMASYPQSVAFVFLFWVGTTLSALSLWVFDSFYFWTPLLSPWAQILITYIVFLSYQLTVRDYQNWRLEQQREYLLEVEQLKNNFVSLISHDLKTPIAKIQGICDRLLNEYPKHEFSSDLQSLRKESTELDRYIQSILQISRIESRDFKLNKDSADINDIAEKVVEQLSPLAEVKHINIHLQLEPMFLVELDSVLIHEVILNLVENAIKYTPEGNDIFVSSIEQGDQVLFQVRDTGVGISEDDQNSVFEKFFRSSSENMRTKGSGMGLYLVKYFIELHGGRVFIKSKLGEGTTVGFSLPVSEEVDTQQAPEAIAQDGRPIYGATT